MADMPAEDALNNNESVKRYIARLQRRKVIKCWAKCFFKFLKYHKIRILAFILCLALITARFLKMQSESLPPRKPNMTKKLDAKPKAIEYDHAGMNINKLPRKVREKQCILEDKNRFTHRTYEYGRVDIKQDGDYVFSKRANKITEDALQLYDVDNGVVDYACLYTGTSILATPDTYNLPLRDYSEPPELTTPDVTPKYCFTFWGNSSRVQIALSQKIIITAVSLENAPEAIIGEQKILTPRTFAIYGFEDPRKMKLTEIGMFNYNIEKGSTQTFAIPKRNKTMMAFAFVELRILNNHSHGDLTCVYRFRLHGNPY